MTMRVMISGEYETGFLVFLDLEISSLVCGENV